MAGGQERTLRRKIKSVQSTKKITKAMELIAASRIQKAISRMANARPYYREISEIVRDLVRAASLPKNPYTEPSGSLGVSVVISVTSDRGLCGIYNSSVLRATERLSESLSAKGSKVEIVGVGKKAQNFFKFQEIKVATQVNGVTETPTYVQAMYILGSVLDRYERGEVSEVYIISHRFVSIGVQNLETTQLLPISKEQLEADASKSSGSFDFEFEPSREAIVVPLFRQFTLARLFALLLEASAAEYAYRQRAMKSASENAEELSRRYRRLLNRARQDSITTEIMEIVGGAEALKGGEGLDDRD
ncbi:ATP synthase F1 subcomplex gamma subunit [Ferrithrix thermotolerans DSM 19514]|uniref:ATP synthase gamma chain n=1 Tax=Ferrithrix thermotolerans DSM 19514 TaxID=1121881 RepID=A0A1M4VA74_9ACTN|nr:ATP synthase F1 subunit gamma [Ferrithrix thermotolerans]SHE65842.1 ATP synthase F1 subcomplex gamma subunit [Ferrithrix thermotolerans DSM 19514]